MADFDPKNPPGAAALRDGFSTISKSLQTFAAEMQRASKDSFESTTQLMEKLRTAKSVEEVVAIQTNFMQSSFSSYADTTRRMSELMLALPMELAKQGRTAFQQGTETMTKTAEQAGEQIRNAAHDHGNG